MLRQAASPGEEKKDPISVITNTSPYWFLGSFPTLDTSSSYIEKFSIQTNVNRVIGLEDKVTATPSTWWRW